MRLKIVELFICVQLLWHPAVADGLIEVFKWKQLDYCRPPSCSTYKHSPSMESQQTNNNHEPYIPYNNIPMGVTHTKGRLFVAVPRRSVGILSTLNYIDIRKDDKKQSPKLIPYPDLETNQFIANSKRLVSVYRTTADTCGRLWFVDTGMLQYPNNATQIQRPSIWIMDLKTNSVLRRYEIPESVMAVGRGLISLTVDVGKGCDSAFAYLPDLYTNQLHVYRRTLMRTLQPKPTQAPSIVGPLKIILSIPLNRKDLNIIKNYQKNSMWSFQNDYFRYDPNANKFNIAGQSFSWNDGIFSTTLGPKAGDGSRNVFFHPMASFNEFLVSNKVLQDEAKTHNSGHDNDFRLMGSRGIDRQSTMHEYDPRTGVVFYAEIQRNAIGCWNTKKPLAPQNLGTVAQDAERMIYPSDLTIDEEGTMWVLTNSMPVFIYSTLDPEAYHFRIWKQDTTFAVRNTMCI